MRFDSRFNLKWIRADNSFFSENSFKIVNQCVLVAKNASSEIIGVTVFEPRDLDQKILEKIQLRRQQSEFSECNFEIYIPKFLRHRAVSLSLESEAVKVIESPFLSIRFAAGKIALRSRIRVVNVDDSPVLLKFLKHTFESLGYCEVVSQVSNSQQAAAEILRLKPDIVTLDIQMPGKSGVDVVQELLPQRYFPILMISSLAIEEGSLVFEALNSGAFDYIQKPKLEKKNQFCEEVEEKLLAAVKSEPSGIPTTRSPLFKSPAPSHSSMNYPENLIWCIGASTGGTQALTRVFTSLPTHIPATLVVQHIPPVFSKSFADSLNKLCPFTVKEAEHGEFLKTDHVYIAPGGYQMGVQKVNGRLQIAVRDDAPVNRFKPSVDYLFGEVKKHDGLQIVAGILTGMGRDGAQGLLCLKNLGARTFAQDEASSAVFGMPRAAFEIGAAERLVPIDSVAQTLLEESAAIAKAG